jgi:predicted O-methyltransferase YrrM
MPRPPFELRAMEMEERRRAAAHRRLRRAGRMRRVALLLGGLALVALGILTLHLAGFIG